jgi:CelD/BcsL family acetyltransferase involved in cellulose biosynthesis
MAELPMMTVEVLDAETDEKRWLELWEECGREPFAHPGYGRLFAQPDDRAVALVMDGPDGSALLPLILRTVQDGVHDAISPYGYGGPFLSAGMDAGVVLDAVSQWARREHLCSVFLRLSLGLDVAARPEIEQASSNVVVDLRRPPDDVWRNYEHKVRKNVKKALRAGCRVERHDLRTDVDRFLEVYAATMRRRDAPARYHFDRDFIMRLADELAGFHSTFVTLDSRGRTLSVEIVLESDRFLYSYLGGTLAEAFPMSPNDLLKHEIVRYGQDSGRSGFVLGGGYRSGDGIFRYKRSFDPGGVQPFHVAKIIGDRRRYADLVAAHGRVPLSDQQGPPFFPAYRTP